MERNEMKQTAAEWALRAIVKVGQGLGLLSKLDKVLGYCQSQISLGLLPKLGYMSL